jgi:hypothetical protein
MKVATLLWNSDSDLVYLDTEGTVCIEHAEELGDEQFQLYCFECPRLKLVTEDTDGDQLVKSVLVSEALDLKRLPYYVTKYDEWFHDDLASVASSAGRTTTDMEQAFCSDAPATRVHAYMDVGRFHGFDNFDGYAKRLSEEELNKRWD